MGCAAVRLCCVVKTLNEPEPAAGRGEELLSALNIKPLQVAGVVAASSLLSGRVVGFGVLQMVQPPPGGCGARIWQRRPQRHFKLLRPDNPAFTLGKV